jgi:hypothetical protein
VQQASENGRRCAKRKKNQREAGDEQQRVHEGGFPRLRHVVERHARDEAEITRHEGQHARREKAQQAGTEGDRESDRRFAVHRERRPR